MSGDVILVPASSRKKLRKVACTVRHALQLNSRPFFPIVDVLEFILPTMDQDYSFEVLSHDEMGDSHGLTFPKQKRICVREDVYDGACNGQGRDRFTLAHELGHLILHTNVELKLARKVSQRDIPAYRSSEWQANCFAGELLMPEKWLKKCASSLVVAEQFGVSIQAAQVQLDKMNK